MRELTEQEREKEQIACDNGNEYYCPLCEGDIRGLTEQELKGDSSENCEFSNGCVVTYCRTCGEIYYGYLDG